MKYLCFFLLCFSMIADEVKMKDGSLLKGTITKIHKGKITLNTSYAGSISISQDQVDSYSTDKEVNTKNAQEQIVQDVVTPEKNKDILTLWSEGNDPDVFQEKWVRKVWFAFKSSNGNSGERNINIGFDFSYLKEFSTLKLYGRWSDEEDNDRQTTDEWILGADYERRIADSRSSWYARAEYERDKIDDIKLAQTYAVGYGYYFIDEEPTTLRGRVGLQYRMDDYYDDDDTDSVGLDFGLNFKTDITEKIKWFTDITYTPSFEDFSNDYKIKHESGVAMPLDAAWDMYLKAGVEHDYNSMPSEGNEHLDTEYFLRLEVEF